MVEPGGELRIQLYNSVKESDAGEAATAIANIEGVRRGEKHSDSYSSVETECQVSKVPELFEPLLMFVCGKSLCVIMALQPPM